LKWLQGSVSVTVFRDAADIRIDIVYVRYWSDSAGTSGPKQSKARSYIKDLICRNGSPAFELLRAHRMQRISYPFGFSFKSTARARA